MSHHFVRSATGARLLFARLAPAGQLEVDCVPYFYGQGHILDRAFDSYTRRVVLSRSPEDERRMSVLWVHLGMCSEHVANMSLRIPDVHIRVTSEYTLDYLYPYVCTYVYVATYMYVATYVRSYVCT